MYDKIIHLSVLLILIYDKINTTIWLKSCRDKFINYDKVKNYFILQRFVTYTSLGNNLAILSSFYSLLFNSRPEDIFFILTWNTLFCITIGYWLLVYPKLGHSSEPTNILLDIISHGPVLILYSILAINYEIVFTIESVIYPLLLGYFYLFFIWLPWYKLTGDTVYDAMDKRWNNRFMTIFKMNFISLIGHLIAIFLF